MNSSVTPVINPSSINKNLLIGRRGFNNFSIMRGLIDDVRIYNRALSASEIAELYRMDTTGTVTTTGALSSAP